MKHSVKSLIRRRLINIIVITLISLVICTIYLGMNKFTMESSEIIEELQIIPKTSSKP